MNRRELPKGAACTGAACSEFGVPRGDGSPEYDAMAPLLLMGPLIRTNVPPPYDPAAAIEAMRRAGFEFGIFSGKAGWSATWCGRLLGMDYIDEDFSFPSFVDAVRSLHRRAAEVDPKFAEKWPVPDGE